MPDYRQLRWLGLAVVVLLADLATKAWAESALIFRQPVEVLPFLNWTLAYNTGAAFSFLAEAGGWQRLFFITVALVVSTVLVVWLTRLPRSARWLPVALMVLLGGAVGNLHDRLLYGHVVDFIHFHAGGFHFPAFNVADMGITVGAIMLIIDSLFLEKRRESQS